MDYILGKTKTPGCFLCEHPEDASAFRRNLVLVAQPHAMVCLNRFPFTASHLLVAPRAHVADPSELSDEAYAALMMLLRETITRLKRAVACEGMNVGFNLGKVAGAGVADHLHGHVVPRWVGDTNFMPVIGDARVMPEYLEQTYERLLPAFADLPGAEAGR